MVTEKVFGVDDVGGVDEFPYIARDVPGTMV